MGEEKLFMQLTGWQQQLLDWQQRNQPCLFENTQQQE